MGWMIEACCLRNRMRVAGGMAVVGAMAMVVMMVLAAARVWPVGSGELAGKLAVVLLFQVLHGGVFGWPWVEYLIFKLTRSSGLVLIAMWVEWGLWVIGAMCLGLLGYFLIEYWLAGRMREAAEAGFVLAGMGTVIGTILLLRTIGISVMRKDVATEQRDAAMRA